MGAVKIFNEKGIVTHDRSAKPWKEAPASINKS
jgi:hypothetical protein